MSASIRRADIWEQLIIPGRAAGKCPQGIQEGLEIWTRTKLCSLSHKHAHHTDKIKVFMMANASQGAQQLGPVLSLRASSLGGSKGLLGKQTHLETTFAVSKPPSLRCHFDRVYQTHSAAVPISLVLRDGVSASWLRDVAPLAPTYLGLGTRSASAHPFLHTPSNGNEGQRPLQLWLPFHSDIFQSEWLVL